MSMRWIVSTDSSKTIRRSWVKEQACKPFILPLSLCVLSEGSKGSFCSKLKTFLSPRSFSGEFLVNLFADLMKCFSKMSFGKSISPVPYCFHGLFNSVKFNGVRFAHRLQRSFFKGFALLLFFDEIAHKIPDFPNPLIREFKKHFVNIGYFRGHHASMINNKRHYVNIDLHSILK